MNIWLSRVQDDRVWGLMKDLGPAIDSAMRMDDLEPDASAALNRLKVILTLCGKRLGASDPLTLLPATLQQLSATFESQRNEVVAFESDRDINHLINANSSADQSILNLPHVPGTANSEELIDAMQALSTYRSVLEDYERKSAEARSQSKLQIRDLDETLQAFTNKTQSDLAVLKSQIDAEKQRITAEISEHQKVFTDSETARLNTFNETLLKVQETLTKTITDQQGQFSSAQEGRSREFANTQTESQKRFSDLITEFTQRLTNQDAEFTKERDVLVSKANTSLSAIEVNYENSAKKILDQMDNHRKDIEKLVGVIGNSGVTSGYLTTANSARRSMWVWNAIAVLSMLGLIYFAYHAFLPTIEGDFKWPSFAGRVFLTVTVGVLAAYAASQADRFFKMERYHRKLALELAAIDPFIALLPQEEQYKFKLEIGRRSFAQDESPVMTGEKSPATTLDILASKETKQLLDVFTDTLIKLKSLGQK